MEEKRQCGTCNEWKELSAFYKRKSGNYIWSKCKKCISNERKEKRNHLKIDGMKHGQKFTIEQLKEVFKKIPNLKLLSTVYINNESPLEVQCKKCNHIWNPPFARIVSNKQLCPNCEIKNKKVCWSDVLKLFNKYNIEVLSKESDYKTALHSKIKFKCNNCGLVYDISYTALKSKKYKNNNDCIICKAIKNQIPIKFSDIKKSFEDEEWIVYTKEKDYKNQNESQIDCECPNGHRQMKSVRKWRIGRRCPICITSGPELEIRNFLEKNKIFCNYNDRKKLNGLELDFLLNNKSIEFNGDYWHCNPKFWKGNDINIHKNMTASDIWKKDKEKIQLCKKNSIDILTIWEDDWKNNKSKTKLKLLSHLT